MDQRAALVWVKRNIRAFGGDPANVALFGESSGGTSVALHLVSKRNRGLGLFRKAVLESPGIGQTHSAVKAELNYRSFLGAMIASNFTGYRGTIGAFQPGAYTRSPCGFLGAPIANMSRANATLSEARLVCSAAGAACTGFRFPAAAAAGGGGTDPTAPTPVGEFCSSGAPEPMPRYPDPQSCASGLQSEWKTVDDASAATDCLLSVGVANGTRGASHVIWRDSIFEDEWAPVVDGVELDAGIAASAASGSNWAAPDLRLIVGSNLDEGTEFLGLTPPVACDANASAFAAWAEGEWGAALGARVPAAYAPATLEPPFVNCSSAPGQSLRSSWWMAAVRSSGDSAVRCPAMALAEAAASASYGGGAFQYAFDYAPSYSVNWPAEALVEHKVGAFHGAEVPFVFQYGAELVTEAERTLAKVTRNALTATHAL
jgi:carboxylesterase type B